MRLSRYFMPTLKENPVEAQIVSHRLMLRAGMIRQSSAGIYTWLPLGLRVLKKIENIIREEQDRAGAQELLMPTLQPSDLWKDSGRYDAYGPEMLRITDRHDRVLVYGPTAEEEIGKINRFLKTDRKRYVYKEGSADQSSFSDGIRYSLILTTSVWLIWLLYDRKKERK